MVRYKYIIKAIEKSYHNKPHLGALPHDRRSTSYDELKERYDECNNQIIIRQKEIIKLTDEIFEDNKRKEELQKKIDKYQEDNHKFYDADDKEYEKKIHIWSELDDKIRSEVAIPDDIIRNIRALSTYFPKTSWVNKEDQPHFKNLANQLKNWKKSAGVPKGSEWDKKIDSMVEDIRTLGKNNKEITKLHSKSHSLKEMSELQGQIETKKQKINENSRIIQHSEHEINDFNGEKNNIKQRCNKLNLKEE